MTNSRVGDVTTTSPTRIWGYDMHIFWVIVIMFPGMKPLDLPQHYSNRKTCETIKFQLKANLAGTQGVDLDQIKQIKMDCQSRKE